MSKITQALEKAARERLQRGRQPEVVSGDAVTVPLVAPSVGDIATIGQIELDPHIVTGADGKSAIAEQYRILKTNLQSLRLRSGPKVIVLTSSVNGEGKSVTALNLAITLARQEQLKVALVDADLRKSSIHRWLGLPEGPTGLSTVLRNGGVLNGGLMRLHAPPLTVLPAGPMPEHPAELLDSSAMRRLLATLKTQFDLILVDSPPVLPVADPGILASQADGVLLVVRAGKTQRRMITQAQVMLAQMKATVIGCVLTHVEHYLPGYYRYYHYYKQEHDADAAAVSAAIR